MQNRGIITICTGFLIDYAFREPALNKISIQVAENNLKSRAIPERLGLVNEDIERAGEYLYGVYVDCVRYTLTAL